VRGTGVWRRFGGRWIGRGLFGGGMVLIGIVEIVIVIVIEIEIVIEIVIVIVVHSRKRGWISVWECCT